MNSSAGALAALPTSAFATREREQIHRTAPRNAEPLPSHPAKILHRHELPRLADDQG